MMLSVSLTFFPYALRVIVRLMQVKGGCRGDGSSLGIEADDGVI